MTPGQAAYEAWHAKLAEHHPVVLALRQPKPWGELADDVHAEWDAAAQAAINAAATRLLEAAGVTMGEVTAAVMAALPPDADPPPFSPDSELIGSMEGRQRRAEL